MNGLTTKKLIAIFAGAGLMGFGVNAFNLANGLAEGGITGVAILLKLMFDVEPWLTTLLINVPLLVIGWRMLGRAAMVSTLIGTVALSAALWLFRDVRVAVDDPLLAALYAGAFVGAGLGLVFRAGGTTGGIDVIARIVRARLGWKNGRTMFVIDAVVLGASLVHLDVRQVMYTIVAVFIGTRVLDVVQDAAYSMRAALIVSTESERIRRRVTEELGRGVTILRGVGGYTGRERDVLYVVVSRSEVVRLERMVLDVDPRAFVTITESGKVLGEGFTLSHREDAARA